MLPVKKYLTYKKSEASMRKFRGIFFTMARMFQLSGLHGYDYELNIRFFPKFMLHMFDMFGSDDEVTISEYIDLMYYAHSGLKHFAPSMLMLFDILNKDNTDEECDEILVRLITSLCMKYKYNWDKLYDLMLEKYEPLKNYKIDTISIEDNSKKLSENLNELTKDVTKKYTEYENKAENSQSNENLTNISDNTEERTNTSSNNENQTNNDDVIYGFNSGNTGVKSNESINNNSSKNNENTDRNISKNQSTNSTDSMSNSMNENYKSDVSEDRDYTKENLKTTDESGNKNKSTTDEGIRDITYQELFNAEMELIQNNNFLEKIFEDIDRYIALEVY